MKRCVPKTSQFRRLTNGHDFVRRTRVPRRANHVPLVPTNEDDVVLGNLLEEPDVVSGTASRARVFALLLALDNYYGAWCELAGLTPRDILRRESVISGTIAALFQDFAHEDSAPGGRVVAKSEAAAKVATKPFDPTDYSGVI